MGSGKQSADKALNIIDEVLSEIESYSLESTSRIKTKNKKKKKIDNLDDNFWQSIRNEISSILVSNYNNIRITNSPKYYQWKTRARENGINIVVTEDGGEAAVIYIRPALRTGTLRERLKNVEVVRKGVTAKNVGPDSLEFTIQLDDLKNNYGNEFFRKIVLERTGQDILALTDNQIDGILEKILSHYERG
jgi:hypothetical protein